jgi:hypothetical protein
VRDKGVCNEHEISLPLLNFQLCCEVEAETNQKVCP